jgi:hypothetical protein
MDKLRSENRAIAELTASYSTNLRQDVKTFTDKSLAYQSNAHNVALSEMEEKASIRNRVLEDKTKEAERLKSLQANKDDHTEGRARAALPKTASMSLRGHGFSVPQNSESTTPRGRDHFAPQSNTTEEVSGLYALPPVLRQSSASRSGQTLAPADISVSNTTLLSAGRHSPSAALGK